MGGVAVRWPAVPSGRALRGGLPLTKSQFVQNHFPFNNYSSKHLLFYDGRNILCLFFYSKDIVSRFFF